MCLTCISYIASISICSIFSLETVDDQLAIYCDIFDRFSYVSVARRLPLTFLTGDHAILLSFIVLQTIAFFAVCKVRNFNHSWMHI